MRYFKYSYFVLVVFCFFQPDLSQAFVNEAFYGGLAYQSENMMSKITTSDTGAKSTMGTTSYPLLLKFDYLLGREVFISPKLTYSIFPRSAAGSTGKVTEYHLMFPVGMNISGTDFSWSAGFGILNNKFQGQGGIMTMNNGNGTADFAAPGQTKDSTRISFNLGAGYQYSRSNVGLDLLTTGTLSSKRTYSLMLSYLYQFTGSSPRQSTGTRR